MKKSKLLLTLLTCTLMLSACSSQKPAEQSSYAQNSMETQSSAANKNESSEIDLIKYYTDPTPPETTEKQTGFSEQASQTEESSDDASEESSEKAPTPEASDAWSRSSQIENIKPGTKKVSSELAEKYKFFSFSNIESEINHRFPALTQEQFDKMAEYIKTKNASGRPYDQAVAAGLVDPDAPKMTLEKMQTIIEDAKNNKELKDYVIVEYESEGNTYQYKNFAGKDCYFGYILDEALKIQPYFDYIIHESTNYMLTDEEGNQTGRIAIVFDTASPYIYYENFTAKEDEKFEILFDAAEQS